MPILGAIVGRRGVARSQLGVEVQNVRQKFPLYMTSACGALCLKWILPKITWTPPPPPPPPLLTAVTVTLTTQHSNLQGPRIVEKEWQIKMMAIFSSSLMKRVLNFKRNPKLAHILCLALQL